MTEQQLKRRVAHKVRIGDILVGKPVMDGEKFSFLEFGDKKVTRVNIIGNIVDKYESEGEKRYSFLTIDDGSGQIKLKSFGDDAEKLKNLVQGQTVTVIGLLRVFNNEIYISPEIVREQDPRYLVIRKMEIEKERAKNSPPLEREQVVAIKDRILEIIKKSEDEGGIEIDKIIMNSSLNNASPDLINQEIQKLLEEGIIFEPRPGKLRWLG